MSRTRSTSSQKPTASGKKSRSDVKKPRNVLLRDLDPELVDVFKARAEQHGRSLQSELHLSLRREARRNFDEALRISEQWHAKFSGRTFSEAKSLIDEDRRR